MTDYTDLIVEARSVIRDECSFAVVPEPRLLLELADALEALLAAPVLDREATFVAVWERLWPGTLSVRDDPELAAEHAQVHGIIDAILASGILRGEREVAARALEDAADAFPGENVVRIWLRARAAEIEREGEAGDHN